MLFLIVEHFKNADPAPVYARLRSMGRMTPPGLHYVNSWVTSDLKRCYQIMECQDRTLLDSWIARWVDLVDFEIIPVVTSAEAASLVLGESSQD